MIDVVDQSRVDDREGAGLRQQIEGGIKINAILCIDCKKLCADGRSSLSVVERSRKKDERRREKGERDKLGDVDVVEKGIISDGTIKKDLDEGLRRGSVVVKEKRVAHREACRGKTGSDKGDIVVLRKDNTIKHGRRFNGKRKHRVGHRDVTLVANKLETRDRRVNGTTEIDNVGHEETVCDVDVVQLQHCKDVSTVWIKGHVCLQQRRSFQGFSPSLW